MSSFTFSKFHNKKDNFVCNSRKKNMILYHIHVLIKNNFVIITVIMKVTCNDKFNTVYYFWTLFYFMV